MEHKRLKQQLVADYASAIIGKTVKESKSLPVHHEVRFMDDSHLVIVPDIYDPDNTLVAVEHCPDPTKYKDWSKKGTRRIRVTFS